MIDIVYCKECVHRPIVDKDGDAMPPETSEGFEDTICPFINTDDYYYNKMPPDDFFCKLGKRRKFFVVVKNMDIPESCAFCSLFNEDDICAATGFHYNDTKLNQRMIECPLQRVEQIDDLTYKETEND